MKTPAILAFLVLIGSASRADAVELTGIAGYARAGFDSTDSSGAGFGLSGRWEAGPAMIETGVLRAQLSRSGDSFWMLPFLLRMPVDPPFFTAGLGPDLAWGSSSGVPAHPGLVIAFDACQDVGGNFGVVLDLRQRIAQMPLTLASIGLRFRLD